MTTALQTTTLILAVDSPEGPEFGKSSPFGLLIILLLLVATALLIWSMNNQLKKLPKSFDADHPEADQAFDDGTDPAGAGAPAAESTAGSPEGNPDPSQESVPHKSADM
ncbi:hypothetical protein GII30_07080 [Gordonia amarae]|uniref:Uncharacterized protein n=2 Tax=Gordonia amarae TaxID=36821 RepID=G7GNV0_9ACTN|nr:hypothetical protein [Gordonia amarae]MCS3878139.1 hypothetical protein [Gordonia amarae]QHN16809.1 hypothetical protein GII35_07305 [Gordonia amarae]QHN21334.1 hypothetical protein GII34_07085 [Gordonia amarae]QHN30189.1 hypothetical protein GII32_07095 [Gordonia amarae]QHN38962.1 hypothetical protein GII30_07080 [Gordonia amarae]